MIILASSSQYRKELLNRLALEFNTIAAEIDEDKYKNKNLDHIKIAETLSLEKAKEVQRNNLDAIIIGSDQVLSFEGEIFE